MLHSLERKGIWVLVFLTYICTHFAQQKEVKEVGYIIRKGYQEYKLLSQIQNVQLLKSEKFYDLSKKSGIDHSNHIKTCNTPQRFQTVQLLKTAFSSMKEMRGQVGKSMFMLASRLISWLQQSYFEMHVPSVLLGNSGEAECSFFKSCS